MHVAQTRSSFTLCHICFSWTIRLRASCSDHGYYYYFFTPKCFGVYFLRAMCHADPAQISDQKTAHWLGLVTYRVVHIRFQQL